MGGLTARTTARTFVGLAAALVLLPILPIAAGCESGDGDGHDDAIRDAIRVEGESAAETNIPAASDRRASGGRYLALATSSAPPPGGWFATYEVEAPVAGVYRLRAVATPPVEQPHVLEYGSYFELAVNGAEPEEVARSQPRWMASPAAWGDLSTLTVDDVELRRGTNTITFVVDEPTVSTGSPTYRLLLDELVLTPTGLAVEAVRLGDPVAGIGTYRDLDEGVLHLDLNGRAESSETVGYRVTDYFGDEVVAGTATVPAGEATAAVDLPDLPPGSYRATASLGSAGATVGHFARLPEREAVRGAANRFGVNTAAFSVVPPSRLDAVVGAMRAMGAGYVRDGDPTGGGRRGDVFGRVTEAFHRHGLGVLEVLSTRPGCEVTEASTPLPADLRDAYASARQIAREPDGARPDAVQAWNEPDNDATSSTGDQHAAYVKAVALGLADGSPPSRRPLMVLSGIAGEDNGFQDLMLRNDVARYADAWAFHAYPDPAEQDDPEFPGSEEQHELRGRFRAETEMWATESGVFLDAGPDGELTADQQVIQARYLVRSTVEDLASGTDRHFWFVGPSTYDGGIQFGLLSPDLQPWPAYSAHAALASILGEANYVDQAIDLSSYTFRYVFDAGGRVVTVVWAAEPTAVDVPVPGRSVDVYDIMGRRTRSAVPAERGRVRVEASPDPVYVVSDVPPAGPARTSPTGRPGAGDPSPAERIVLSQRYDEADAAPNKADGDAEPPLGYRLDGTTRMALDVYNFGPTAQTVTLTGRTRGGWSVSPADHPTRDVTVDVPAMGRVSVPFTITAADHIRPGADHPLVFEGTLGGAAGGGDSVPPSVARIQRRAEPDSGSQPASSQPGRIRPVS